MFWIFLLALALGISLYWRSRLPKPYSAFDPYASPEVDPVRANSVTIDSKQ